MRLIIIGGKLQGVEACYLGKCANYTCVVIDKDKNAPASALCDEFICGNVLNPSFLRNVIKGADAILPAIEDAEVLSAVKSRCARQGIPFLYDDDAYAISSSKLKSNLMFEKIAVPTPLPYAKSPYPLIGKLSGLSGSVGVRKLYNQQELDEFIAKNGMENCVLQQYLEGPSYSLEVIGLGGKYLALQTTELFMDKDYDCCKVIAPASIATATNANLEEISLEIAKNLGINGIFDVEVILHQDTCKVLEIDARLPSQTPTAVYHSTGINMLQLLCESAVFGNLPAVEVKTQKNVLYEHIYISNNNVEVCGEHIMATAGPLTLCKGFLGADVAIVSKEHNNTLCATLIFEDKDRNTLFVREQKSLKLAKKYFESKG